MNPIMYTVTAVLVTSGLLAGDVRADEPPTLHIERVTTRVPFPRGLVMKDDMLYVLCRGRVRGAGGVSAAVNDQAGTIYVVDPDQSESISAMEVSEQVRTNGVVFARPTDPPFQLWDRSANPPESDQRTDRPYCTLRYDKATQSFYICGFSGIDKRASVEDPVAFSKNFSDVILRYDLRTESWNEVERHDAGARWVYPHHDPAKNDPPHGWLKGPDNCLILGDWLYAVSKDNSMLVRYDLRTIQNDADAPPPESKVVMHERADLKMSGPRRLLGQSALAFHDGWLYIAYRTTSEIIRIRLDKHVLPISPLEAELIARFDPFDPDAHTSADMTDMCFDDFGRVYVVSAKPASVYRFTPDPDHVFDARNGREPAWADMADLLGNPRMKSENLLYYGGWLYITSGDGYSYQDGADGTVYRVRVDDNE